MAVKLADQAGATHMAVVEEVEPSRIGTKIEDCASTQKSDKAQRRIETEVKARIDSILKNIVKEAKVQIKLECIFGKQGYCNGHFAETSAADLLVMNNPDTNLGFLDRVITHEFEYILSELPSHLLLVQSHKH